MVFDCSGCGRQSEINPRVKGIEKVPVNDGEIKHCPFCGSQELVQVGKKPSAVPQRRASPEVQAAAERGFPAAAKKQQ